MQIDTQRIVISSDHAGYEMKEFIKSELEKRGIEVRDEGTYSTDSVDYPLFIARVAKAVSSGKYARGIAICGSGLGASMTANRFKNVRAALCMTEEMAKLSRLHNNANVLVLAGRLIEQETASSILDAWLSTEYEGGRHNRRIELIDKVNEMENF